MKGIITAFTMSLIMGWNGFFVSSGAQDLDDFKKFVTQDIKPVKIRFLKYYPRYREHLVSFYDVHYQSNAYIVKHTNFTQTNDFDWPDFDWPILTNYTVSVNWNNIYYTYNKAAWFQDSSLKDEDVYYHEIREKLMNSETMNAHDKIIYDLHEVLNLGVTYAPLWEFTIDGETISSTNSFPSDKRPTASERRFSVIGDILVNVNDTVVGLDLWGVRLWLDEEVDSGDYHWLKEYHYDDTFSSEPSMPSIIDYKGVRNNTTIQLHRFIIDHFEYSRYLPETNFLPVNVLGETNINTYYRMTDDGWIYTNEVGHLMVKVNNGEDRRLMTGLDRFMMKFIKIIPILILILLSSFVFWFIRTKAGPRSTKTN